MEARGRDEGGEVNRDHRIRLYLEDNREPLKVHNLWRDRGRFVLCENDTGSCYEEAGGEKLEAGRHKMGVVIVQTSVRGVEGQNPAGATEKV